MEADVDIRYTINLFDIAKWSVLTLAIVACLMLLYFFDQEMYVDFAKEDSIAENLSFLFYLFAGIFFLATCMKNDFLIARNILPALLGLFFLIVAGEEISWGQRVFGFSAPDIVHASNTQGEFNIHNLALLDKHDGWLNQHTLLNLFVLLNGVILPLLSFFLLWVRMFFVKINFPVVPLSYVPIFFIALVYGFIVPRLHPHWAHSEVKELLFAFGFVVVSIFYYKESKVRGGEMEQ